MSSLLHVLKTHPNLQYVDISGNNIFEDNQPKSKNKLKLKFAQKIQLQITSGLSSLWGSTASSGHKRSVENARRATEVKSKSFRRKSASDKSRDTGIDTDTDMAVWMEKVRTLESGIS